MTDTTTMQPSASPYATLAAKIAAIAGEIKGIQKDGYNPHQKYSYPRPETVYRATKTKLAERQIAVVPHITRIERAPAQTSKGNTQTATTIWMHIVIIDGETGQTMSISWAGEGWDAQDKGIAKAQTIAMRTLFMHLFQIPSGEVEDPDAEGVPEDGATYEDPQAVAQAAARVYAKHADVLKGTTWDDIVKYMHYVGDNALEPQSVEDWKIVDSDIANHKKTAPKDKNGTPETVA